MSSLSETTLILKLVHFITKYANDTHPVQLLDVCSYVTVYLLDPKGQRLYRFDGLSIGKSLVVAHMLILNLLKYVILLRRHIIAYSFTSNGGH